MQTEVWTEERILAEFSDCENLRELIAAMEKAYTRRGSLLCEIRINGMLLEDDDEIRFAATPIREIKEVIVMVGGLDELLEDVKVAFQECIPSLQETALKTSEYFRAGQAAQAQNSFSALLEGCQWLVDTLVHVRRASLERKNSCFTAAPWESVEKDFSLSLRQILLSFQRRDHALLADLLEYELTTILDSWLAVMNISVEEPAAVAAVQEVQPPAETAINHESTRPYEAGEEVQDSLGGR